MRGTGTKLLIATTLCLTTFSLRTLGQCALITDNYSGQVPSSVCAPVNLTMDVRYKFILPVDPSRVQILYVWNDGTGATTTIPATSQGDTIFTATATHVYPPADACSYTAEAYVIYNGEQCVSSSRQEQTFSAWARDNENSGVIITQPVVAQYCEGDAIIDQRFTDNSTFNCNIMIEPDKPNRITRWVQFIYGTTSIGGDRIPDITIEDPLGNVYQMTDALGNSLPPVAGPVIEIPIPADGPDQISWPISAPPGGVAGDIFEITMRNWNICNPFDKNPFDTIPPADSVDGDYPPITTTALIEIITTPPEITNPSLEFCAGSPVNLTLSTSGGVVNWYTDSLLTNHIHTGNSFNPVGPPTYIDNSVSGTYSYYVTETLGACASAPSRISFEIFDTPAPTPDAGRDTIICADTFMMQGNTPVIGTGEWSTTGGAAIEDPSDPNTIVRNLAPGPNLFRWTMHNGPCIAMDEVIITSDLQPAPANAGSNQSFCDLENTPLHANTPINNGIGSWSTASGNGNFSDIHDPSATVGDLDGGENILVWTIRSRFGACPSTTDTIRILRDITPDPAYAGPDRGVCDSLSINLSASPATGGGSGTWSVVSGSGLFADAGLNNTEVSNIDFGSNQYRWTVTSMYGMCSGSSDDVLVRRDEAPVPAFAGFDQALCSSVTAPLGANAASVGTGSWSVAVNPSPTDPVFNPSVHDPNVTVEINPGNEGIYRFAWTIINGSCITSDSITVDFGMPTPPADAGPDDSICGISASLSANDPGIGTGTWRKVSGPGNVTFLPGANSRAVVAAISPGDEGLYTFEWKITSGSCPPTADTVSIFYKPIPDPPMADDEERCGPGTLTLNSTVGANGDVNRWYENATGGAILATGNSFTTPVLSADKSYWISSYNSTNGCESYRRIVNAVIHAIPDEPVASDIQHCGSGSFTITSTVGTGGLTNHWFDASSGGNLLALTPEYTTPVLTGNTDYWISSYNDTTGCESNRIVMHVVIDTIPSAPLVSDAGRCGEGMLELISAVGSHGTFNRWYDAPSGGSQLADTTVFTTPYLTASTDYWVSSINSTSGCEGPRQVVHATIHPIPGFPDAGDVSACGPDSLILHSTPGFDATVNRWYDQMTGGTLLAQENDFETPYLTTTQKYYVSSYNETNHCESSRREVTAIILPVPAEITIQGPVQVGIGQTNVIYSVNYQPGSVYHWDIPPGMNLLLHNQNFVIVEFSNIGTYNISVTETNSIGCTGPPATKQVEVLEDIIVLNISMIQDEVCAGENLQLAVLPSGGTPSYTFEWTGDTQYLSSVSVSNPIFNTGNPGIYDLGITVTDINGNPASDTLHITVHPNPSAQISIPDTVVCVGYSLQLNTTVTGGSGIYNTYRWDGATSALSATDIPDPVFSTLIPGYHTLAFTVEDHHGCAAGDTVILFNDTPVSAFTSTASPGCSPLQVSFTNQSQDAVTWLWNFGDGSTSNLENPDHVFTNNTNSIEYYNTELTAISINNCMHTSNAYVTVYPNPNAEITTYPDKACAPADILFSATPGGFSYEWDFGDGVQTGGNFNIMHTFSNDTDADTTYHVQLIATSFFNCLDTAFAQVTVYPSPAASFVASPLSQMEPERTVNITNTTEEGNWTYYWSFGDDHYSTERDPVFHTYPGPDDYLLKLVVRNEHCADSTWEAIEIVPHPPVAQFKPVEPGCMPLTIQFENTSAYSNNFLWEFGDGAVSNKPDPEYTYYESGTYKIKLTAWGEKGSADSYSTVNDVWILPNAYFEIAPRIVYVNDQDVHFFNLSDNGDIYLWDFGDGTTSDDMSPSHMYEKEGNYDVVLNVWTENDCYDLYQMKAAVLVEPSGKIVFPNAFRPESEIEENRIFKPGVIDHVEEYHLMVFNRWGEMIFESFDRETGWDGYVNGMMAKEDVYVWKVEGKYSNGQTFVQSGDVTLLH
ncbi:MAG: PKD domain-containing protein [Bacteroidales bacterium]|nr:PKD domain-containing protein [Bacteroidales bacterium]